MTDRTSAWDAGIIAAIAATDNLHIAPFREDGTTLGTPTWIWSVVVEGELFVRAWNGRNSRWYRAAMRQHAGRIIAAGHTLDVRFDPANPEVEDAVDAAYRTKYAGSTYLPPMVSPRTRAATVKITPAG